MKKSILVIALLMLSSCTQFKKLTNTEEKPKDKPQFYVVACCRDNNGSGIMTYPDFVPESHVQLCESAANGEIPGPDTYLAMRSDCEQDYKIGSQYYKGKGY